MRDVLLSQFVRAAVRKQSESWPTFKRVFERAIVWQLERMNPLPSEPLPDKDPPVFVIVSTAWKTVGIPRIRIAYIEIPNGIELRSIALWL